MATKRKTTVPVIPQLPPVVPPDMSVTAPVPLTDDELPRSFLDEDARECWRAIPGRLRHSYRHWLDLTAVERVWAYQGSVYTKQPIKGQYISGGSQRRGEPLYKSQEDAWRALYCDLRDNTARQLGQIAEWM